MDILVGLGPNFVMRQGQMEINHGCKVLVEDDLGEVLFLEKPAHRSLSEVAKVVVAHLRVCGVSEAEVNDAKFAGVEQIIKLTGSTVTSTLSFPELLREETRAFLVKNFQEFLIKFWRGHFL
jgi:hypothetical protein